MSLVEKSTTGFDAPPIQLPVNTVATLKAKVAIEKAAFDADPATYAGKGETMDKYVNNALKAYF